MNDTVTKLLYMADEYAYNMAEMERSVRQSWLTQEHRDQLHEDMDIARKDLQDELTKLFTPLKGQTFNTPDEAIAYLHGYAAAHDKYKIMGEKNETA